MSMPMNRITKSKTCLGDTMKIILRPTKVNKVYDDWTFNVFSYCKDSLTSQCDYLYCDIFEFLKFKEFDFEHNVIIFCILDNWCCNTEKNANNNNITIAEEMIKKLSDNNPDRFFIILSENIYNSNDLYVKNLQNVKFISCLHACQSYKNVKSTSNLKISNNQHVVCFLRNMRPSRLMLCSFLHGLNFENNCYITSHKIKKFFNNDLLDLVPWEFNNETEKCLRDIAISGFEKLKQNPNLVQGEEPYELVQNTETVLDWNNIDNFDKHLQHRYQSATVEIVSETLYDQSYNRFHDVTEKFTNCVFGFVFPIFVASQGYVNLIRSFGFDVFDDIVDHTYDNIADPAKRMQKAILDNKKLLADKQYSIDLWHKNYHRFVKNYEYMIGDFIINEKNRINLEFKSIIDKRNANI